MSVSTTQDMQTIWKQVSKQTDRLRTDRAMVELTLQLVRQCGNDSGHFLVLGVIAEHWAEDPPLALSVAALLIEQADSTSMDCAITQEGHPALLAARTLQTCLSQTRVERSIRGLLVASLGNALRMSGPNRDAEALEALEEALSINPNQGQWWFDLGLLHKWRGRFEQGLQANLRAQSLLGKERKIDWNIAICATAIGDGQTACQAWGRLNISAEINETTGMPCVDHLPPWMVRVPSRDWTIGPGVSGSEEAVSFELLWVAPLSPCHGVIQSPAFGECAVDYGDVILWDGASVATHQSANGKRIAVFAVLENLRRGNETRLAFLGVERVPGAAHKLEASLPGGSKLFMRTEHKEQDCPAHSCGENHPRSVSVAQQDTKRLVHGKVILPKEADLVAFAAAWEQLGKTSGLVVAMPSLYEALGQTRRAGQEHRAWGGIERASLRRVK